jgi:arylformamidase
MTSRIHTRAMRSSRTITLIALVALLAVGAAACGGSSDHTASASSASSASKPTPVSAPPASCRVTGVVAHRNLRYASDPGVAPNPQSLDLFVPQRSAGCAPAPVVAYVHGGGFRRGDKANQLQDKIKLFTDAGYAFASLNYRLVGAPGAGPTNGMYPASEQDVATGIGFLADHAAQYDLNPERIMLLGHSAGAFLVAAVTTDGSFLHDAGVPLSDIACVAPLDTTYDIPTQVAGGGVNAEMYRNAFGADPAVWTKGSPSRNVAAGKSIPSFHIVTRGSARRVAEAQAFGQKLRDADVAVDVQVVRGLSHNDVNDHVGQAGDTVVTPPLMAFFANCAK